MAVGGGIALLCPARWVELLRRNQGKRWTMTSIGLSNAVATRSRPSDIDNSVVVLADAAALLATTFPTRPLLIQMSNDPSAGRLPIENVVRVAAAPGAGFIVATSAFLRTLVVDSA